jgi:ATP synthase protein I
MDKKPSTKRPDFQKLVNVSSLALMLPSSIVVGLFFGYMLDKWLKTSPWMILLFFFLGTASGLISLLRGINKYKDF